MSTPCCFCARRQAATVFLQQLGRGLRRSDGKAVLTVLDFIGQHRKEFRFEEQFRALTNLTRNRLLASIEHDFPQLPSGCQIILEPKAKDLIIDNIRSQLGVNVTQLAREVGRYRETRLGAYLQESRRELKELYRGGSNSWTGLLRRAELLTASIPEGEEHYSSGSRRSSTSMTRNAWRRTRNSSPTTRRTYRDLNEREQAYARMLYFSLWPLGGFTTYVEALNPLRSTRLSADELRQVLAYNLDRTDHVPVPLLGDLAGLPLTVHASYSREEILAGPRPVLHRRLHARPFP